jgi:hypothetical protein
MKAAADRREHIVEIEIRNRQRAEPLKTLHPVRVFEFAGTWNLPVLFYLNLYQ